MERSGSITIQGWLNRNPLWIAVDSARRYPPLLFSLSGEGSLNPSINASFESRNNQNLRGNLGEMELLGTSPS
ncbi:hypothetical protein V6N13_134895 [Hibiscus sabdariffa]